MNVNHELSQGILPAFEQPKQDTPFEAVRREIWKQAKEGTLYLTGWHNHESKFVRNAAREITHGLKRSGYNSKGPEQDPDAPPELMNYRVKFKAKESFFQSNFVRNDFVTNMQDRVQKEVQLKDLFLKVGKRASNMISHSNGSIGSEAGEFTPRLVDNFEKVKFDPKTREFELPIIKAWMMLDQCGAWVKRCSSHDWAREQHWLVEEVDPRQFAPKPDLSPMDRLKNQFGEEALAAALEGLLKGSGKEKSESIEVGGTPKSDDEAKPEEAKPKEDKPVVTTSETYNEDKQKFRSRRRRDSGQ